MNNDNELKIISNETKDSIDQMSIVTPSVYASIFSKFAAEHNTEIEDESEYAQDLLQLECSTLTKLQNHTAKSAEALSNSTTKAISAIQDKDESKLNEVLKETQSLRIEVEKLKVAVYKDELTHTFNRKWLHDNYLDEKTGTLISSGILAMIDLNFFKIVNDTHGHVIGDKVLIFIANELQKSGNKVVRYGGDEFIILFDKSSGVDKATKTLNSIREVIITKKLKAHNTTFRTSFSIGVCPYLIGDDLGKIIEIADKNMYEDKLKIKKRVPGIEI